MFGMYNSYALTWDEICYFTPYYLPFKSAGNDRSDAAPALGNPFEYYDPGDPNQVDGWVIKIYDPNDPNEDGWSDAGHDTIGPHGVAKNIMTVGAVDDAVSGGLRNVSSGTMSAFSGWGPADDGRIKPDIVANGILLYSAHDSSNSAYASFSGTSMAAPNASGSAILLAEYYGELFPGQAMRASTLKGLIIHTADDLGNTGPDYVNGWGLMDTEAAAAIIMEQYGFPSEEIIVESTINEQGTPTNSYAIAWDGTGSFRVTLCWTDPIKEAFTGLDNSSPALVNDLDIRITSPGGVTTYFPYILNPGSPSSPATTGDNILDNVEQINIAATGVPGVYILEVSRKGILKYGKQDYSLIIDAEGHFCCHAAVSSYPYGEGFEAGFGDWINEDEDDINWTRYAGSTPSFDTGPSMAYDGSYYLYIESSGNYPNKRAILNAPCFDLTSLTQPELRFWYHMYGSAMGDMTVEVSNADCSGGWDVVWSRSGDQGNEWREAIINLSAYNGLTVRVRFIGDTGPSDTSDMAIDGIHVAERLPIQPPFDLEEFSLLSQHWMLNNCGVGNDCAVVDWYFDGVIDVNDLLQLGLSWLSETITYGAPEINDNFETGDFSHLLWQLNGSVNWTIVSDEHYEGTYSAKSGGIDDYEQSTLQFTVNATGLGTISFYRKVYSESGMDYLRFYIDGVQQDSWSGDEDWELQTYDFALGEHTFKWSYTKDGNVATPPDCGWIDNILVY